MEWPGCWKILGNRQFFCELHSLDLFFIHMHVYSISWSIVHGAFFRPKYDWIILGHNMFIDSPLKNPWKPECQVFSQTIKYRLFTDTIPKEPRFCQRDPHREAVSLGLVTFYFVKAEVGDGGDGFLGEVLALFGETSMVKSTGNPIKGFLFPVDFPTNPWRLKCGKPHAKRIWWLVYYTVCSPCIYGKIGDGKPWWVVATLPDSALGGWHDLIQYANGEAMGKPALTQPASMALWGWHRNCCKHTGFRSAISAILESENRMIQWFTWSVNIICAIVKHPVIWYVMMTHIMIYITR